MIKARKKLSSEDWKEVEYVQLKDSYVITKAEEMEFDAPVSVIKGNIEHWQDVRERAAIAAMQAAIFCGEGEYPFDGCQAEIAKYAVEYADALVEELKKKQ